MTIWMPLLGLLGSVSLSAPQLRAEPALAAVPSWESRPIIPQFTERSIDSADSAQFAFPSFDSPQLNRQIQLYQRYTETFGRPDILIIGSSRALWGVDPIMLQQTLAQRGYPNLRVFNFGVNGATAQVIDLILRQILPTEQIPRLIIWADGVRAFNSGRPDLTYRNIVASPGYRRLLAGTKPMLFPKKNLKPQRFCIQVPFDFLASAIVTPSTSGLSDRGQLEYSSSIHQSLCGVSIQVSNLLKPTAQIASQITLPTQEASGFQPLSTRFNPAAYFERYPRVPGKYDADYQGFRLKGEQMIAFQQVLQFFRIQEIPLVFVSLPLTETYLDSSRTRYEGQFRGLMQKLSESEQFVFYDLSQQWQKQHDYFLDPSHLNRYGAAAVSQQLGRDLTETHKALINF